jgi:hypothetical protein
MTLDKVLAKTLRAIEIRIASPGKLQRFFDGQA